MLIYRLRQLLPVLSLLLPHLAEAKLNPDQAAPNLDTLPYPALFDAICDTAAVHFYDTLFIAQQFPALRNHYARLIEQVSEPSTFSRTVHQFLDKFNTSHTSYYTAEDNAYYHLAAIFHFLPAVKRVFDDNVQYPSIGLLTVPEEQGHRVTGVLNGSSAEVAGFRTGDRVLTVNDVPYRQDALQDLVAGTTRFQVLRGDQQLELFAVPRLINPQEELEEACRASSRMIKHQDQQFAYIHLWSFAGERYYELLKEQVLFGKLKDADALILDLRGGWGGANPEYLNLFNRQVPVMHFRGRNGASFSYDSQWRKPVVLLVDDSVRSGKEILAFGFRRYGIGRVFGSRTAGAVTGGRVFFLPDDSLLYLAVNSATVDGEILEGKGVEPDILVLDDPQTVVDEVLEAAIDFLGER